MLYGNSLCAIYHFWAHCDEGFCDVHVRMCLKFEKKMVMVVDTQVHSLRFGNGRRYNKLHN